MSAGRFCPECGSENLPERRYCRECGVCFIDACPDCGASSLVGDAACAACQRPLVDGDGTRLTDWQPRWAACVEAASGPARYHFPEHWEPGEARLDPAAVVASENRLATVVKADLSGFTAMSELLGDPEEVTIIMNQVFEPLVEVVRRHDGYIDNYAGDMIISFWGAPNAVEAGAEHAVRSALEMRAAVETLNARGISHGVELGISTGVATGAGLWGEVGTGANLRHTLSGELGDYAALLEKYTDRGHVGICPATTARVRGRIAVTPIADSHVTPPGETEEQPIYNAEALAEEPTWLELAGADTVPRAGRDKLGRELAAHWQAAAGGVRRFVHLAGEPGSGKSRLAYEVAQLALASGAQVLAAGGRPLSRAMGWTLELPPVPRTPALIVLDGLNFVDSWPLERVLDLLPDQPVLVLTVSRDRQPAAQLRAAGLHVEAYEVPPLDAEAVEALAQRCLSREVSEAESDWLWHQSEGNPLLVRALCGLLGGGATDDGAELEHRLERLPWPMQEFAAVALDQLSEPERAAAYVAAMAADQELRLRPEAVGWVLADPLWSRRLERLEALGLVWREDEPTALVWRHRCVRRAAAARLIDTVRVQIEARLAAMPEG
ncbi:MAG: hypothetical protein HZB16_21505 [Armatimonadetes bacterium]|nr:hypothetical protein [Armatimonadota bacterium]